MKKFKMYMKPTCPFCRKVMRFAKKKDIELELLDINEDENKKALQKLTGDIQVPCLLIDGKPLLESDDIIKYLAKEYGVEYTEDDLKLEINACPIF